MCAHFLLSLSRFASTRTVCNLQSSSNFFTYYTFSKIRCLSMVLRICKSFAIILSVITPYSVYVFKWNSNSHVPLVAERFVNRYESLEDWIVILMWMDFSLTPTVGFFHLSRLEEPVCFFSSWEKWSTFIQVT